jgi:inner membrane protein
VNPLIHAELGWLSAQKLKERRDRILVTAAGVLPDLDGLTLLGGEDLYGQWHHVLTHGVVSASIICAILTAFAKERLKVFGFGLFAFHLHLVCDLAGSGPGWPIYYLWPFSRAELFWSGQWDLASWQNAVIGLGVSLTCLWCAMPLGRTVFEIFSVKGDAAVVMTLRKRFARRT